MARIYLDRLKKKYKKGTVSGKNYKGLIEEIMVENSKRLDSRLLKITDDHYKNQNKKIKKVEKRFRLPDLEEVIPRKVIGVKKSVEKGSLITDDLRDKLSLRLRDTLKQKGIERRAGSLTGTLKREVLDQFEQDIKKTFVNYTKKDPKFGVPANIRSIATTELRGAVSKIKGDYNELILQKNPDSEMTKTWIHNMKLLKSPENARESHVDLNGTTISNDEMFRINDKDGVFLTPYPHHDSLPAGQKISCQCEAQYRIRKK